MQAYIESATSPMVETLLLIHSVVDPTVGSAKLLNDILNAQTEGQRSTIHERIGWIKDVIGRSNGRISDPLPVAAMHEAMDRMVIDYASNDIGSERVCTSQHINQWQKDFMSAKLSPGMMREFLSVYNLCVYIKGVNSDAVGSATSAVDPSTVDYRRYFPIGVEYLVRIALAVAKAGRTVTSPGGNEPADRPIPVSHCRVISMLLHGCRKIIGCTPGSEVMRIKRARAKNDSSSSANDTIGNPLRTIRLADLRYVMSIGVTHWHVSAIRDHPILQSAAVFDWVSEYIQRSFHDPMMTNDLRALSAFVEIIQVGIFYLMTHWVPNLDFTNIVGMSDFAVMSSFTAALTAHECTNPVIKAIGERMIAALRLHDRVLSKDAPLVLRSAFRCPDLITRSIPAEAAWRIHLLIPKRGTKAIPYRAEWVEIDGSYKWYGHPSIESYVECRGKWKKQWLLEHSDSQLFHGINIEESHREADGRNGDLVSIVKGYSRLPLHQVSSSRVSPWIATQLLASRDDHHPHGLALLDEVSEICYDAIEQMKKTSCHGEFDKQYSGELFLYQFLLKSMLKTHLTSAIASYHSVTTDAAEEVMQSWTYRPSSSAHVASSSSLPSSLASSSSQSNVGGCFLAAVYDWPLRCANRQWCYFGPATTPAAGVADAEAKYLFGEPMLLHCIATIMKIAIRVFDEASQSVEKYPINTPNESGNSSSSNSAQSSSSSTAVRDPSCWYIVRTRNNQWMGTRRGQ